MSNQRFKMPMNKNLYLRIVAAVFMISSATSFITALMRIMNPELFYLEKLQGSQPGIHYFISGMMVCTSAIGFLNSCVVLARRSIHNTDQRITMWLLIDSIFETSRVVYVFIAEMLLKGKGPAQIYDLMISAVQYLLDSALYAHVILGR